jgi:CHAD domain-containing protein
MRGVSRGANVESVHHMRVAIRRLLQCLRFFAGMFPQGKVKKIRRDLKRLMTLSAEVRDRDIALSLLAQIGVPKDSEVMTALAGQRRKAAKRLETAAKLWKDKERSRKWRAQLSL